MRRLPGQPLGPVRALAFAPDGTQLTAGSVAPSIIATHYHTASGFRVSFQDLVPRGDEVRQWDLASGQDLPWLPEQPPFGAACLAPSPDGRDLLAGSGDGTVWRWDVVNRRPRPRLYLSPEAAQVCRGAEVVRRLGSPVRPEHYEAVRALAVSPDGALLAVACEDVAVRRHGFLPAAEGGRVELWDAARGEQRRALAANVGRPACVAFSPDGTLLGANDGGDVILWDPATGKEVRRLSGHREPVCSLAFSSDGKILATGSQDRHISLWDLAGGTRRVLVGHTDAVAALAFAPDGRTLASGGWDGSVRLWHVATAQGLAVLEAHTGKVHAVAFAPDGRTLAGGGEGADGGGEVYLWRAAD
jgi:WD40 repeat protein